MTDEAEIERNKLLEHLLHILAQHCGKNEGAVETLERIIRERDTAQSALKQLDLVNERHGSQ